MYIHTQTCMYIYTHIHTDSQLNGRMDIQTTDTMAVCSLYRPDATNQNPRLKTYRRLRLKHCLLFGFAYSLAGPKLLKPQPSKSLKPLIIPHTLNPSCNSSSVPSDAKPLNLIFSHLGPRCPAPRALDKLDLETTEL